MNENNMQPNRSDKGQRQPAKQQRQTKQTSAPPSGKNRNWKNNRQNTRPKREGEGRVHRHKRSPETIAEFQKANELLEQEILFEIGLISDIKLDV